MRVPEPAKETAKIPAPDVVVTVLLDTARLTLLGVLASIGLSAAGVALTLDERGWVGAAAGLGGFLLACLLLRSPWSRSLLARFADRVLPPQA